MLLWYVFLIEISKRQMQKVNENKTFISAHEIAKYETNIINDINFILINEKNDNVHK